VKELEYESLMIYDATLPQAKSQWFWLGFSLKSAENPIAYRPIFKEHLVARPQVNLDGDLNPFRWDREYSVIVEYHHRGSQSCKRNFILKLRSSQQSAVLEEA
jgi:hypothetical protein